MDRVNIYPGAIPLETDLLKTNRFAMVGLGKFAETMLGQATRYAGFGVAPTPVPSLSVVVAPGAVYAMSTVDASAYSSLPADASALMKQGVMASATTLNLTPPTTAGQALVYLVQVSLSEIDTDGVVLPYYNASNPTQAFAGPGNDGSAQPTVRKCAAALSLVAGAPAPSAGLDAFIASGGAGGGGFTPPPASAGAVGVAMVIVRYGDTTVNSASIIAMPAGAVPRLSDLAPKNSPALTGTPTAPTPDMFDDSARIATTAMVQAVALHLAGMLPAATPAGLVNAYAGAAAPSGWLLCDGAAVSRTTFAALFAEVGTRYGVGNGTTTFNLPDLRGEFIRGLDAGRGVDPTRTLGSNQADQLEAHKHMTQFGEASGGTTFGRTNTAGRLGTEGNDSDNYWFHTNDGTDYDGVVNSAGVVGTETRPRNVALNFIIKT